MATRISCIPFDRKMEIVMVEQDVLQQELAKCSGIANPTVSDIVYGYNQCE